MSLPYTCHVVACLALEGAVYLLIKVLCVISVVPLLHRFIGLDLPAGAFSSENRVWSVACPFVV